MKRLLRLTPLVAFAALNDGELRSVVEDSFNSAAAGISGQDRASVGRHHAGTAVADDMPVTAISPGIIPIQRLTLMDVAYPPTRAFDAGIEQEFESVADKALLIVRKTGRVTNSNLREMAAITSEEAREVLQTLVRDGVLARRGVRRGTYYVLSESADESTVT
ncbi:hypothetical protein E2F47_27910 [Mycobacterium eburneum]|nr:hypothetical protein [Mycobacterium eburneum]TDH42884.1 hypothetical protein E2F47_27910 [Mycobacterium eburneum]